MISGQTWHLSMFDVRNAVAAASHAQESLAEKVHFGRSTLPSAGVGGSIFGLPWRGLALSPVRGCCVAVERRTVR
jgi:hypothetical protein